MGMGSHRLSLPHGSINPREVSVSDSVFAGHRKRLVNEHRLILEAERALELRRAQLIKSVRSLPEDEQDLYYAETEGEDGS